MATVEDLHPDVLNCALRLLDGPALAAASCATSSLRSLSSRLDLWRDLCLAAWPSLRTHPHLLSLLIPSFPHSYRSFFSDAFPSPSSCPSSSFDVSQDGFFPSELISAVDLRHRGVPVFSRVVETGTSTPWFLGSPFRVDALDPKYHQSSASPLPPLAELAVSPEDLTLSWVLIDPDARRAVDVSSRRPVSVEQRWYTGETVVRFATVLGDGRAAAVASVIVYAEETGHVWSVSLAAEGVDGGCLNGRESLGVLSAAISGERKRWEGEAKARGRWEEFVGRRRRLKETMARREGAVDLACGAVGAAVFVAFMILVIFQ